MHAFILTNELSILCIIVLFYYCDYYYIFDYLFDNNYSYSYFYDETYENLLNLKIFLLLLFKYLN